jgi:hypothetical protein
MHSRFLPFGLFRHLEFGKTTSVFFGKESKDVNIGECVLHFGSLEANAHGKEAR